MSSQNRERVFKARNTGYGITVKKLIEELQKLPKGYRVFIAGASGYVGGADLIDIETDDKSILIHSDRDKS